MAAETKLIVVGSVGIDDIETPQESRTQLLGGSANYACIAASYFIGNGMVGVVGTDFPAEHRTLWESFGIDLAGLQTVEGKTFRWSGVYEANMNNRSTKFTELNVFEHFNPELPEAYRSSPFVFLANISPELQLHVLEQVKQPKFVMMDTMDLWIDISRDALTEVIGKVDLLTMNESEALHYTGESTLLRAARVLQQAGPEYILIKKGEHGSMLFYGEHIALMPAFPLETVKDPTGAGDTFAGGLMGALAAGGDVSPETLRKSMLYGTVVASFGVEAFSVERYQHVKLLDIEERVTLFREMLSV